MSQPKFITEYREALKAAEAKIARLEAENAQLKRRVRKLEGQIEAAQRAAKRQVAPFSRRKRKPSGQPPGRRSGAEHGRHTHRQAPERVDVELFAELPEACPDCGSELEECGECWEQFQEELPEIRALVTRVSGKWARCRSLRSSSAGPPSPADLGGDRRSGGAGGTASAGPGVQPAQGARAVGAEDDGDDARAGHRAEPRRAGAGDSEDRRSLPADLPGAGGGDAAEPGGERRRDELACQRRDGVAVDHDHRAGHGVRDQGGPRPGPLCPPTQAGRCAR